MVNAIDPQQLMQMLNKQQQGGGSSEQYPSFFGNKKQIIEMVSDYFAAKTEPKVGLGDEIHDIFYSLEFGLAHSTVAGVFMDWFSPFYLLSCINNFGDSIINAKTTGEVKLIDEYKDELKLIGKRAAQYHADLSAAVEFAKKEKEMEALTREPGEMERKAYEMKMKEMDKIDIPPVDEFVEMIYDAGAKFWACKATVDMFHLSKDDFCEQTEDIINVGTFYEISTGGQIIFTY